MAINVNGGGPRNQACGILVAIDMDTVYPEKPPPTKSIVSTVQQYISSLNQIYESSILKNPPNQQMYLRLQEMWLLRGFMPGCRNESIVLNNFGQMDTSPFCLAHLITHRSFGCVIGLATVGGLCKKSGNTAFTVTQFNLSDKNRTINTMAHEVGHNFGSGHDGTNSTAYSACKSGEYIMGGGHNGFSTCSLQAMQHRIHEIINSPDHFNDCFTNVDKNSSPQITVRTIDVPDKHVDCARVPQPSDDICGDNHVDPPEPPTPPPDPVCGNGKLEHPEECDCGETHEECDDPCCYPATLSDDDRQYNSTAEPCRRYTHHPCSDPFKSTYMTVMYSWIFLLLLALIVGLALIIDWRGRRYMYGHIMAPDEDIRINPENGRH